MEAVLNQDFARHLTIPPRPEIVTVLFEEMNRAEPDLARVDNKIAGDVSLTAAMLKAVNSPAFGLARKAGSMSQAVDFLGMRNVSGIATGLAIRYALSDDTAADGDFWDMAEKTALLCATLGRMLPGIAAEEVYTFGLFHDCGIPLLMRQFPHYEDTLARANQGGAVRFATIEEADVGTHHGAVAYFFARSWQLPDDFCRAVLWHHDTEVFDDRSVDETVRNFVGIVHIAEHLLHRTLYGTTRAEWTKFEARVLAHFGLGDEGFRRLADAAQQMLGGI